VRCNAVSDGMFQGTAEKQCCCQPGTPSWVARVGAPTVQEPLPGSCASKGRPETVPPISYLSELESK
jgi:hypothetical protein